MIAASAGGSGMSLTLVCGITFVAILVVALIALFVPLATRERKAKNTRLVEVSRYRVLSAYTDGEPDGPVRAPEENALTARTLALIGMVIRAKGRRVRVLDELERTGLRMRPEEWVALQLAIPVGLLAVGGFLLGPIGLVAGAVLGWLGCRGFVRIKTKRRRSAFEAQLPDALQLLAGALRTGFALNQSLLSVVREGLDPISTEFGRALHEVRIGAELEDALDALAERMKSEDMRLVVMAIRTAREVGGNLAEVLLTTMATMRERVQLRRQVRTLTAEGRLSAKVLIGLPFVIALALTGFNPTYLSPLIHTGIGIAMLVAGSVLLVIGSFWLVRLTKIEV